MSNFLMPSLGADMEAGTLIDQLIPAGDAVHRGDIIAVVETQKGAIEIEVFEDGTLEAWLVGIGEKVPVGTPLATIRDAAGETQAAQPRDSAPQPPQREEPQPAEPPPQPAAPTIRPSEIQKPDRPLPEPRGARPAATPAARRLAARKGIDLRRVPVGPGGAIYRSDVRAWTEAPPETGLPDMRQAIAAAMTRSKREIPHYYLSHCMDLTRAEEFVSTTNSNRAPEDRIAPAVLYLKAISKALQKYPEFNGHFVEGRFTQEPAAHIGLAINIRGKGLVAPALFDVGAQGLDDLMAQMRDLIDRVRAGRFKARELSDATITLTSLGDRGVDGLFGVIYPPQVAIVGIGTPASRPWIVDGGIVPRRVTTLTLAADHRVSDGHRGALFLRMIDHCLQEPETL